MQRRLLSKKGVVGNARAERSQNQHGTKNCRTPFASKIQRGIIPQEACSFESGGPGSTNKKKIVGSGNGWSLHKDPRTLLLTSLPAIAPSLLPGCLTGPLLYWRVKNRAMPMPSCHNTGVILSPLVLWGRVFQKKVSPSQVLRTRRPEEKCSKVFKNGYGSGRLYRGWVAPLLPPCSGQDCRSVPANISHAADSRLSAVSGSGLPRFPTVFLYRNKSAFTV